MIFEQSIQINASSIMVDRCITNLDLMHKWLNPMLRCEPIGTWSTSEGSWGRFVILIPVIKPSLKTMVLKREPGLIVWGFKGFFNGSDSWKCVPNDQGTLLINCFEFDIPNPIINWGFNLVAAKLTKQDMEAQLKRLKRVAEELYLEG